MRPTDAGAAARVPSRATRYRGRSGGYAALAFVAICLIAIQVRNLLSFSQWYTDEDQTLLWFAGRDLIRFHVYSPNVLGSNYNTVFEALPGAVLHLLGMTLRLASPLGVTLMVTLAWLLLAIAAYVRRQPVSAALALALPACLSVPYLLSYDQLKGVQTGDLLAASAVAVSIVTQHPWRRLALMIALAGVAFAWDNASVIATAPALLAAVGTDFPALRERWRRSLATLVGAALVPVALEAFNHFWYAAHPGYVVSPPVDTSLQLSVLWGHLTHPDPLFGIYAPELLRSPWITLAWILGVLIGAVTAALITRRVEPGLAALGFASVLLVVLSAFDTDNFQPGVYLTGGRFMFLMPMGAWVVVHHTLVACRESGLNLRSGAARRHRWRMRSTVALGAIAVVAVASTTVAQASFRSQVKGLISFGLSPKSGVQMQNASELLADCRTVTGFYRRHRVQVLVSLDQPLAYGCAAQSGLNTLFPPFDRRPWLVEAAHTRPVDRILLWGGINCQPAKPLSPQVGLCTPLPAGAELLVTPRPRPVAETLAMMGVTVYRPKR